MLIGTREQLWGSSYFLIFLKCVILGIPTPVFTDLIMHLLLHNVATISLLYAIHSKSENVTARYYFIGMHVLNASAIFFRITKANEMLIHIRKQSFCSKFPMMIRVSCVKINSVYAMTLILTVYVVIVLFMMNHVLVSL